jgi:hypothetical protein
MILCVDLCAGARTCAQSTSQSVLLVQGSRARNGGGAAQDRGGQGIARPYPGSGGNRCGGWGARTSRAAALRLQAAHDMQKSA